MNIQLIQAPRNEGYLSNSRSACYVPLGLISIATYCKSVFPKAKIEVLDGELLTLQEIVQRLVPGSFVGIETKTLNYLSALAIAKAAKERGCTIILGGVFASAMSETILKNRSAVVDYIVNGYGEVPFVNIIKGELGISEEQPRVIKHPSPDFDELPFLDRNFVNLPTYIRNFKRQHPTWSRHTATNIYTLQGCENNCLFCSRQTPEVKVVCYRNPKRIWKEVLWLKKEYGIDYLVAFDDQITQNIEWLKELVQTKPSNLNEITWHVFSNAENITPRSLALLKELPTTHVFVGIETGDPELAEKVAKGRGFSPDICTKKVRLLTEQDIQLTPSFVLGLPGESKKTLQKTLDLAKQIKDLTRFEEVFTACLVPFPGTKAFKWLLKKCPEFQGKDRLDGETLTKAWFKHFCEVDYETAREFSAKILELAPYKITLDKGGL